MWMIRTILFAAILLSAVSVKAQLPLSFGAYRGLQTGFEHLDQVLDTNRVQKKWFVTKFAGISAGFIGFRGGSASFLQAPVGVQLNRQLTNNLYAFANVAVAPAYLHFNSAFSQPLMGIKNYGLMNPNNHLLSINPAANVGLLYTNDQRTFSISGSIGVRGGSYMGYPAVYGPASGPVTNGSRF